MSKELYVGSLSYDTTEYELEKLFSVSGRVTSIHLITDAKTGEFKGCGYVRMSSEAEAKDAIASLDGALFIDKRITVSIANPQKQNQKGGYKGKIGGAPRGDKPGGASRGAGARAAGSAAAGARTPRAPKSATSGAPKSATSGAAKSAPAKKAFSKPASPKPSSRPSSSRPAASKKRS